MDLDFDIRPATNGDVADIVRVYTLAYEQNTLWHLVHENIELNKLNEFVERLWQFRFAQPEHQYMVAIEKGTL